MNTGLDLEMEVIDIIRQVICEDERREIGLDDSLFGVLGFDATDFWDLCRATETRYNNHIHLNDFEVKVKNGETPKGAVTVAGFIAIVRDKLQAKAAA